MSGHLDQAQPYLWIGGLLTVALAVSPGFMALLPAFVAGVWAGALLADKMWSP